MNETTHTPGPWYYYTGAVWTTPCGPDDGGSCVATRASRTALHEGGPEVICPSTKDANMRLAAAAPDLLAVCEEIAANSSCAFAINAARAAIAKAKGGAA